MSYEETNRRLGIVGVAFLAFVILWCCGTAIAFGFLVSTVLVYAGAVPFIGWALWYFRG